VALVSVHPAFPNPVYFAEAERMLLSKQIFLEGRSDLRAVCIRYGTYVSRSLATMVDLSGSACTRSQAIQSPFVRVSTQTDKMVVCSLPIICFRKIPEDVSIDSVIVYIDYGPICRVSNYRSTLPILWGGTFAPIYTSAGRDDITLYGPELFEYPY